MAKKTKEKAFKQKVRKLSIWWKLLVPVNLVILMLCGTLGVFSYNTLEEEMIKIVKEVLETI